MYTQVTPKRHVSSIVLSRLAHARAQQAAQCGQWHLAVKYYLECLDYADQRFDPQAFSYFAEQLSTCYQKMGFFDKARLYRNKNIFE